MTICDAIRFAVCHKHKQALLALAIKGYIMDVRLLGRNNAYALCRSRGYRWESKVKAWLK